MLLGIEPVVCHCFTHHGELLRISDITWNTLNNMLHVLNQSHRIRDKHVLSKVPCGSFRIDKRLGVTLIQGINLLHKIEDQFYEEIKNLMKWTCNCWMMSFFCLSSDPGSWPRPSTTTGRSGSGVDLKLTGMLSSILRPFSCRSTCFSRLSLYVTSASWPRFSCSASSSCWAPVNTQRISHAP